MHGAQQGELVAGGRKIFIISPISITFHPALREFSSTPALFARENIPRFVRDCHPAVFSASRLVANFGNSATLQIVVLPFASCSLLRPAPERHRAAVCQSYPVTRGVPRVRPIDTSHVAAWETLIESRNWRIAGMAEPLLRCCPSNAAFSARRINGEMKFARWYLGKNATCHLRMFRNVFGELHAKPLQVSGFNFHLSLCFHKVPEYAPRMYVSMCTCMHV